MDKWEKETNPRRRRTPYFSSFLLDIIYRSIDESKGGGDHKQEEEEEEDRSESTQNHRSKTKPFRATIGVVVSSDHSKKKVISTQFDQRSSDKSQQKKTAKLENGGFSKTKLKALKIYGELKKVKQPISAGGRIATFINSIFNSGNVKKAKIK
ncbi:protein BIG GRAIN 1-like B [Humulus lupulus]|uniref:protein BIG GRAIN 1-like B n=1 Tax=Humulus lupulus TaxID=3486 RepID=UPI002B412795|nr:protein BIG GRAIN 1-like B [Humulus lupulus]